LITKWWKDKSYFDYIEDFEEREKAYDNNEKETIVFLFNFCQKKYPSKFFEILYQNADMFNNDDSTSDTEFLPHIHFKNLWNFDITDKTRETIWKYLQLILFSVVGTIDSRDAFGESAKLFEAINEEEFKSKLEETINKMQEIFNLSEDSENNNSSTTPEKSDSDSGINMENIPNANDIHDHINEMLGGKLGSLAKEIAEETAANLNMDMENVTDMKDVFNKLIKNPTKLMGLVKNVGDKLDSRIKSGEIKESELIAEASEIMNKMKNMPGLGDIQSLLSKMGMGGLGGKGGKVNTSAMEAQLNKNMKAAQLKEKIRAKAEANRIQKELAKQAQAQTQTQQTKTNSLTDEQIISIFSTGEKVERTPRGAVPQPEQSSANKQSGKKNKNKNKK
jgi:hypothetical protein